MPRLEPIPRREQLGPADQAAFDAIIASRGRINQPQSMNMYVPRLAQLGTEMNDLFRNSELGTHDFEAFRSAGCEAKHAIRTIYSIELFRGEYSRVHLEIVGNAFLKNMVRIIAGNLREVGLGRMTPSDLKALLASRDRTSGAMTAPAHGLTLEEVIYDDRLPLRPKDRAHVDPAGEIRNEGEVEDADE